MRLQLIAALALVLAPRAMVHAQEASHGARLRGALYQDDDDTTIVTTAVEAHGTVEGRLRMRGGYLLDAVTTASVDVVAAATQRWSELRHEARAGADVLADDVTVSGGYVYSAEHDWWSHRGTLGLSIDLAQRSTTLAVGLTFVHSDVGRQDDQAFFAQQQIYGGAAFVAQVVDPDTVLQLGYSLQQVEGYQASPYRYVQVGPSAFTAERHPESRSRHAVALRVHRALGDGVVLRVGERLYLDTWALFATTTEVALAVRLDDVVELEVRDRFHFQTGASFYQERYDAPQRYVSIDRELSTFLDNYVGGALVLTSSPVGPFRRVRFDARADLFYYRYFDYARLEGRLGLLASLGLEATL